MGDHSVGVDDLLPAHAGMRWHTVLRSLGVLEFFSSRGLPIFFGCCILALGGMCYWVSTRTEGIDRVLAYAGAAVAAVPLVVGVVAVVVFAAVVLLALLALFGTCVLMAGANKSR